MIQPSIREFREQLVQALVAGEIPVGIYHEQGVPDRPAMYVGDPPEGVTVSGLEVLIPETPELTTISTFAGAVTIDRYPVRLVAHDGQNLKPAYIALASAFKRVSAPQILQATDRYPSQMVITITP
jgi:hypothetical protein